MSNKDKLKKEWADQKLTQTLNHTNKNMHDVIIDGYKKLAQCEKILFQHRLDRFERRQKLKKELFQKRSSILEEIYKTTCFTKK